MFFSKIGTISLLSLNPWLAILITRSYGLSGTVFSDDGAGNPYYIFQDKVYEFDPIDNESVLKADSLEMFFTQQ